MTTLLVDNATLAGAGRTLYAGQIETLGGEHAEKYYYKHGMEAQNEDRRSLFELITALLLIDDLTWEGSSIQDPEATPDLTWNGSQIIDPNAKGSFPWQDKYKDAWVYKWFPVFDELRQEQTLDMTFLAQTAATERLSLAQKLAIRWVASLDQKKRAEVSDQIQKIPLCYREFDHPERQKVRSSEQCERKLSEDEISLALFVSRGIFYQACARAQNSEGYLPHSFRGTLLSHPMLREAADYCALCGEEISAIELLHWIDDTVLERAKQVATKGIPDGKGMTLGAAFFRGTNSPLTAFDLARKFRASPPGIKLRQHFASLLLFAKDDDKARIDAELSEINKKLAEAAYEIKGFLPTRSKEEKLLIALSPKFIEAALQLMPLHWQSSIKKIGHTSINDWTPYQLIFGAYLNPPDLGTRVHRKPWSWSKYLGFPRRS